MDATGAGPAPADPPARLAELRTAHRVRWLGADLDVLAEKRPVGPRLDVHVARAGDGALTLVTSGMSDREMAVPLGVAAEARAELLLRLPADWPGLGTAQGPAGDAAGVRQVAASVLADEAAYWPIRLLKDLARLPWAAGTWLGPGHTWANGDPARPFPGTRFVGAVLAPLLNLPAGLAVLDTPYGPVRHHTVVPLTTDELACKVGSPDGSSRLFELLGQRGVSDVVDVGR